MLRPMFRVLSERGELGLRVNAYTGDHIVVLREDAACFPDLEQAEALRARALQDGERWRVAECYPEETP